MTLFPTFSRFFGQTVGEKWRTTVYIIKRKLHDGFNICALVHKIYIDYFIESATYGFFIST